MRNFLLAWKRSTTIEIGGRKEMGEGETAFPASLEEHFFSQIRLLLAHATHFSLSLSPPYLRILAHKEMKK